MAINVNLNIHWSAPDYVWDKVSEVCKSMDYYDATSDIPRWSTGDYYIEYSSEPSGLQLYGNMPEDMWNKWYATFKERLTDALGYEIGEPEDGFEFKYDWE